LIGDVQVFDKNWMAVDQIGCCSRVCGLGGRFFA
jgi:hypothetical protein